MNPSYVKQKLWPKTLATKAQNFVIPLILKMMHLTKDVFFVKLHIFSVLYIKTIKNKIYNLLDSF